MCIEFVRLQMCTHNKKYPKYIYLLEVASGQIHKMYFEFQATTHLNGWFWKHNFPLSYDFFIFAIPYNNPITDERLSVQSETVH